MKISQSKRKMADCSTAGTAIDRATRVVLGPGQGQDAAKHVSALLGHASLANQPAMPVTTPQHLTIPTSTVHQPQQARGGASPRTSLEMETAWQTSQSIAHPMTSQILYQPSHQQQMLHHHIQHQQAMHSMFHHQQQIMQQQLQIMTAQANHKLESKMAKESAENLNTQAQINLDNWHEGLEDEALKLEQDGILDDDGIPQGATIEDLAAAWAQAEAEYDQLGDEQEDYSNLWTDDIDEQPQTYQFHNKETPKEMVNWMEEGMQQFNDGNLKEAIRSFEMELQHNNPDNARAWRMLGRCHAENDQDPDAIKCLEAAVDRDPFSPESLLALGVSYVNELNHERALSNMKAWFTHNPKYAGMEMPPDIYGAASNAKKESAFEEVKQLLLSALEFDSTDAGDVYEALGVIYNVIRDYKAASEAFRAALKVRPDDYQLWNKLGATLANGSQSEEALPAYHKALQVKPKYARAWLNMAISHSNLQDHNEAARCYLQTLSLNPGATHCWTYLRMALSCSERWDLLPLVFSRDLKAFQEEFDFVLY